MTLFARASRFGGIHLKNIRNPNIEIRNERTRKRTLSPEHRFRVLPLVVSICFELRISDFGFQTDHRITRSALAKTLGGMTSPICLAVFKLMMSSNFFVC